MQMDHDRLRDCRRVARACRGRLGPGAMLCCSLLLSADRAGWTDPSRAGEPSASGAAASADSTRGAPLLGRADLWYGLAGGAATTIGAFNDRWLTEESTESNSSGEHHIARVADLFGNVG